MRYLRGLKKRQAGGGAFCAGGDIQAIYRAGKAGQGAVEIWSLDGRKSTTLDTVALHDSQPTLQGPYQPRQPTLFNRSADMPARPDRQRANRVDAEPSRSF